MEGDMQGDPAMLSRSTWFCRINLLVVSAGVLVGATARFASGEQLALQAEPPFYVRQPTLQETLLQSRAACQRLLKDQAVARPAVTAGAWHLLRGSLAEGHLTQSTIDLQATSAEDKPLWEPRSDWQDGRPFDFPGDTAILCRTLRAEKPVVLLVGIGAGDRLELLLNGRRVLAADSSIPFGRYGTSMRLDGSRVDQLVATLPLAAGENQLLWTISQRSAGPRQACFTLAPNPTGFIWRQLEKDFPRRTNRLLDVVPAEWFDPPGWLSHSDAALERDLLRTLLDPLGPRGESLRRQLQTLESQQVAAGDRRWLDLCVAGAELSVAMDGLDRLRASVSYLATTYGASYPGAEFLGRLDDLQNRFVQQASQRLDPADPATVRLCDELDQCRRAMLLAAHPLLKGQSLLFVRRYTYDSQHFYDDYYHGVRKYGGSLSRLSIDDGKVSDVVPELSGGVFDRFDLSFEASRIVFGYRPPRPEGFRLWEVGVDGGGLRQLTVEPEDEADRVARYSQYSASALAAEPILHGHWTDDMHPCYLPSGEIVFASSRCERTAVCGGHTLPCTVLYKIGPDGSGMQRLSQGMLSEFTPAVLADGRVMYTRWEYVFKGIAAVQSLWAFRPDGTGSEEIYGDNIRDPGVFYQGRPVPGKANLVVATGCGHEPLAVGSILLVDRHKDKRTAAAMTSLTPDTEVRDLRGLCQRRNGRWRKDDVYGPFYCDPYPLSDKYFLVSCNPDKRHNDPSAYGLYLLDAFGNRVPIYHDGEMSCFVPTLLTPRLVPPVVAPSAEPAAIARGTRQSPSNRSVAGEATLFLEDVYRGLAGVPRGEVKYLRVMRQIPRPWAVWPHPGDDTLPGQMVAVSWYAHIWIAVLEGIVPVEEDGSAHFTVPADCDLYVQALDKDFMEIQRMRTFINLQPGEHRSCIGCHEHRNQAPALRRAGPSLAMAHPPVRLGPQPGETAPRPVHYETDVQPIFDKHCTRCHNAADPQGGLALSGQRTTHFNRSYEEIMSKELISTVREWSTPPGKRDWLYWSMEHNAPIPPYRFGSHASRLVQLLIKGHYEVKLSEPEWVRLVTWVDTNGQYYGSYFGRRNLRFADQKDFRPAPTLASAYGSRPDLEHRPLDPVAAELLAHWTFDEGSGDTTRDLAGSHPGQVVGARWTPGKRGAALELSGNADFVRAGDFDGTLDTLSIALWVRVDSHRNRWNPLLFCDTWSENDLHLSVLDSGEPNVAIHDGTPAGYHRAAGTKIGDGQWHHLALVCDQRFGGHLQFFVDGRPDGKRRLFGRDMPVRLTGVRLGGYNVWQRNPGANFHGALDDVRIYRGMLTAEQVAALAGVPKPCLEQSK
jgi:hypothetical protein